MVKSIRMRNCTHNSLTNWNRSLAVVTVNRIGNSAMLTSQSHQLYCLATAPRGVCWTLAYRVIGTCIRLLRSCGCVRALGGGVNIGFMPSFSLSVSWMEASRLHWWSDRISTHLSWSSIPVSSCMGQVIPGEGHLNSLCSIFNNIIYLKMSDHLWPINISSFSHFLPLERKKMGSRPSNQV